MDSINIEVCADSIDSALIAQSAGACRVELCDNLPVGGTTPSIAQIEIARKLLHIKLYVLIRPRGGDFLYNDVEFKTMKSDIHHCGKIGCDGVVIGILHADGSIDESRCKELINIAHSYSMGVTFHRAFDCCRNLFEGMEDIIAIGCERILTSGGKNTALEGAFVIRQLIRQAGNRIIIMPGAGITSENVVELIERTGLKELHGSFKKKASTFLSLYV
jgi:copper homeostasis protein